MKGGAGRREEKREERRREKRGEGSAGVEREEPGW
jgi:hypothetical protein